MQLRRLTSIMGVCAVITWSTLGSGKSADCADAENEVVVAQQTLSNATRQADGKASAYQQCVETKGRASCKAEHQALRQAMKAKRDAQAAYRYAVAKVKQVCS